MRHELEERILEELRQRIIDQDRKKQTHREQVEMREATKDALAQLTSFSRAEVNAVAQQVQKEMLAKRDAQKKKLYYALLIVLGLGALFFFIRLISDSEWLNLVVVLLFVGGLITVYKYFSRGLRARLYFYENFENPDGGWSIKKNYEYNRYITNDGYVFEANRNDWCYWDSVPIDFPSAYTVKLDVCFVKGRYDKFGLMLAQDNNNYVAFELRADGAASYALREKDNYTVNKAWKSNIVSRIKMKEKVRQSISVEGDHFIYYVDGKKVFEGSLLSVDPAKICLRVCGNQTVRFQYIQITDNATGETVFEEDFKNPHQDWLPKYKFAYDKYFENGQYIFTVGKESWCYWSSIPVAFPKKYEITLRSQWQDGEYDNWGLMVLQNDDNYFYFAIKPDGSARFLSNIKGEYDQQPEYRDTGIVCDETRSITQSLMVDNNHFKYYVDDTFVISGEMTTISAKEVGVRVCGRQTVAFQTLIIEEK